MLILLRSLITCLLQVPCLLSLISKPPSAASTLPKRANSSIRAVRLLLCYLLLTC